MEKISLFSPPTIAYFDCFHGAGGDMLLASLLDAGLELGMLEQTLTHLPLSGYHLEHRYETRHHIRGSTFRVHMQEEQPARSWHDIRTMLETSDIPTLPRTLALRVFHRLARIEACIHQVEVDAVHFHEVGAVDSIVDIVGFCIGLHLLGITDVYASALPLGRGWVETAHGMLPVPAPATLALLAEVGAPILPTATTGELLTPTAAAILAELATFSHPPMHLQRIGYGFGHHEFERLNGLRVWIGNGEQRANDHGGNSVACHHQHNHTHAHEDVVQDAVDETVIELRCNLDDVTGEQVGYCIERLLDAGALDAWAVPLVMKKGRPGIQLACLAHPGVETILAQLMVRETPTLGVRWHAMPRLVCHRRMVEVETAWGVVRVKQKVWGNEIIAAAPEYDDCARLAMAHQIPLVEVYEAAQGGIQTTKKY